MRGQSWTQDAIHADLVVGVDPATGVIQGIDQIRPGYVKRDEIAWEVQHRHAPDGNQPYIPTYLFCLLHALPPGARSVQLPDDGRLRLLAVTASDRPPDLKAAGVLYAPELPEPAARAAGAAPTGRR